MRPRPARLSVEPGCAHGGPRFRYISETLPVTASMGNPAQGSHLVLDGRVRSSNRDAPVPCAVRETDGVYSGLDPVNLLRHIARLGGVSVGWILQEMPAGGDRGIGTTVGLIATFLNVLVKPLPAQCAR
jgi:hypothetical protein